MDSERDLIGLVLGCVDVSDSESMLIFNFQAFPHLNLGQSQPLQRHLASDLHSLVICLETYV